MSDKKNSIWSFFSSVKLTVALLLVIILSSILGTLIPQQEAADAVVHHLSPGMVAIAENLQLFDIYHSLWFILFMVLLAVNLIVCSVNRWPVSWKRFRGKVSPENETIFGEPLSDRTVISTRVVNEEAARVEEILKKAYKGVQRRETDSGILLSGEKGNGSYLGVYVIHASILIILTGMMIGFLWGFDAYMEIPEGESTDTVMLKRGGDVKKLNFTIQCDRFSMEYYEDGTPKLYQSELSFVKNGRVLQKGAVLVNHPATFEGIRFYQTHYGMIPFRYYTGLKVNYDPGVPIVTIGAFSLVAGCIIVFFYAHRQIWIRIEPQERQTRVSVSGKTNKDHRGLDREISRLVKEIQKMGADGT